MQQNQPDVWQSTFFRLPSRWPGPVVTTVYDVIYERYPGFFNSAQADWTRREMKKSVQRADTVICISETTKQDVIQFYDANPAKLHVIPLAPGEAFLHFDSEKSLLGSQRPYILYVGRRANHKNFMILLAAYSRWAARGDIDLVVVGESWSESEQHLLKKNDMLDGIRLISNVDDKELASIYSRALALVYPSLYEGFGLPLLEAMACGCPVVASCIPSNVEVAGDFAIYFEAEDVDALIAALDQAIENGRSAQRVQQGLQHVKTYSWDRAAQQTLAIYREIGG
jgi:glycosyltransferase involved in cell wall biosynthesis